MSHGARIGKAVFGAPGAVTVPDAALGYRTGYRVQDPGGHVMQAAERGGAP
ncbi:MAG: hypothetical protein HY002_11235 [Candidatus Rokubacteria bacterium]|nr:hypothetical protein [Candidatus Rokubacteria bacterium]